MIYGDRIRLRAVERSDLHLFVEWLNDPEVMKFLSIYAPLSLDYEESWFENLKQRPVGERPLVIELRQDQRWISAGNCGFHNLDWRIRSASIGIFIGEKGYWDQGYGTETVSLLLK